VSEDDAVCDTEMLKESDCTDVTVRDNVVSRLIVSVADKDCVAVVDDGAVLSGVTEAVALWLFVTSTVTDFEIVLLSVVSAETVSDGWADSELESDNLFDALLLKVSEAVCVNVIERERTLLSVCVTLLESDPDR